MEILQFFYVRVLFRKGLAVQFNIEDELEPCTLTLNQTHATLIDIHATLDHLSDDLRHADFTQLRHEIEEFKNHYEKLVVCVDEFPDALLKVTSYVEDILNKVKDARSDVNGTTLDFEYEDQIRPLREAERELERILLKYSHHDVAKLEYLQDLTRSGATLENAERFKTNVFRLVHTLSETLVDVRQTLLDAFNKATSKAALLDEYFGGNLVTERAGVRKQLT